MWGGCSALLGRRCSKYSRLHNSSTFTCVRPSRTHPLPTLTHWYPPSFSIQRPAGGLAALLAVAERSGQWAVVYKLLSSAAQSGRHTAAVVSSPTYTCTLIHYTSLMISAAGWSRQRSAGSWSIQRDGLCIEQVQERRQGAISAVGDRRCRCAHQLGAGDRLRRGFAERQVGAWRGRCGRSHPAAAAATTTTQVIIVIIVVVLRTSTNCWTVVNWSSACQHDATTSQPSGQPSLCSVHDDILHRRSQPKPSRDMLPVIVCTVVTTTIRLRFDGRSTAY